MSIFCSKGKECGSWKSTNARTLSSTRSINQFGPVITRQSDVRSVYSVNATSIVHRFACTARSSVFMKGSTLNTSAGARGNWSRPPWSCLCIRFAYRYAALTAHAQALISFLKLKRCFFGVLGISDTIEAIRAAPMICNKFARICFRPNSRGILLTNNCLSGVKLQCSYPCVAILTATFAHTTRGHRLVLFIRCKVGMKDFVLSLNCLPAARHRSGKLWCCVLLWPT